MCNPETKQSFVVLKAFELAGRNVYSDELEEKIENIGNDFDFQFVEEIGPLSLRDILNELALGKMTKPDDKRRWTLTDSGKMLMKVLGGYVRESDPKLGRM